jgi:hypothetical protein
VLVIQTSSMKTNTRQTCQILVKFAKCHDKYFGKLEFGESSKNALQVFQVWQVTLQNPKGLYGKCKYSQTCVQRPPLGPEKRGRYAEVYMKKISGK